MKRQIIECPDRNMSLVSRTYFGCKNLNLLTAPVRFNDAPKCSFRIAMREKSVPVPYMSGTELCDVFHSVPGGVNELLSTCNHTFFRLFQCFCPLKPGHNNMYSIRERNRRRSGCDQGLCSRIHLTLERPVSYTHLTLPTNREV